ncbi:GNAT family N-acetyltransferase [Staphylococcus caeli]|uniref:GNAT family N-acetyltransferase n=1 Tax=Staphylococcus caeli TaxID=2201815 RepID=UPI003F543E7E
MDIVFDKRFNERDIEDMLQIYHNNNWLKHDRDKVVTIFSKATHVVIARNNGKVIGFVRAMSDDVFNAAIYDVVVDVPFQGKGIGKKLVSEMLEYLGDISCVHLISTTGNEPFYEQLGFKKLKTGMARYKNTKLKDEYTV